MLVFVDKYLWLIVTSVIIRDKAIRGLSEVYVTSGYMSHFYTILGGPLM